MKRPTDAAYQCLFSGLMMALLPAACSTDGRGLGALDGGGSAGGRLGSASGGRLGTASGGAVGTASGGTVGTASGGTVGTASGGAVGTASGGAMGTASGGALGTGTGGAASGGRVGTGSGGLGGGGRIGTGGANTGGTNTGGANTGGANTGGANTGGAATGGRGTGGANTGGANTGGAATGGRGTGGAGTGGRGTPQPDCTRDSDCHLIQDCCTCAAIGPNQDPPPACGLVCVQSKCMAQHLPPNQVACVAGRCVAGFNCDASNVTCRTAPPECADGQVPGMNPDGSCYTGSCVPTTQCRSVDECAVCSSTQACVTNQTRGTNEHHCVTVPASCDGKKACNCLGETTCLAPYSSCSGGSGQNSVTCGCPTC